MNYSSYTDEQILEELHRMRTQIERIRIRLESGQGSVDHNDLRTRMSQLNLLKDEAKNRRLPCEE